MQCCVLQIPCIQGTSLSPASRRTLQLFAISTMERPHSFIRADDAPAVQCQKVPQSRAGGAVVDVHRMRAFLFARICAFAVSVVLRAPGLEEAVMFGGEAMRRGARRARPRGAKWRATDASRVGLACSA